MKTNLILSLTLLLAQTAAWAHGEDKLGPHGGYIRMPGAFHTEVVPTGKNQLKVYLLDINWKNPTVASSTVKVTLEGARSQQAVCEVKRDHYLCGFEKDADLTRGKLLVEARREKLSAGPATYELPLRLQVTPATGHEAHQ